MVRQINFVVTFQGVIPDESFAEALERADISQDKLINTLQSIKNRF